MHYLPHIPTVYVSMHRLWSNLKSGGGGRIMRVKRARGRIASEEGEGMGGELATKLGSNYQP